MTGDAISPTLRPPLFQTDGINRVNGTREEQKSRDMHVCEFLETLRVPEIHRFTSQPDEEEFVKFHLHFLSERDDLFLSLLFLDKVFDLGKMALELSV